MISEELTKNHMDLTTLKPVQDKLENHLVYQSVNDLKSLRTFMEHHVYCVWDFMSLLKALQKELAPTGAPWFPSKNGNICRLINEIVLAEESDTASSSNHKHRFISHYEMYVQAMEEVGANTAPIKNFLKEAQLNGIKTALLAEVIPAPAKTFMTSTFEIIETSKPHLIAAAFSLGRENVIPRMFRSLLKDMKISEDSAPIFYHYLNRHIELDEDEHWPMALGMLESLCSGDTKLEKEALETAHLSLESRVTFWNSVKDQL